MIEKPESSHFIGRMMEQHAALGKPESETPETDAEQFHITTRDGVGRVYDLLVVHASFAGKLELEIGGNRRALRYANRKIAMLMELLRIEFIRHGGIKSPWNCTESDCLRFGKSTFMHGCECKLEFERAHIRAVKREIGL